MMCAWNEFLSILPGRLRRSMDDRCKETLEELRLRINAPPELIMAGRSQWLNGGITEEELNHIIHGASRYSPWNTATMAKGYLTAPGGHRIGLCGEVVVRNGIMDGIRRINSMCIRIARDIPGCANAVKGLGGSILILGAPGWGKTTLLRDLARAIADRSCIAVIDEREELFPFGVTRGKRMDVLTGCPKNQAVEMVLRTMGPSYIAVDEITESGDSQAILQAYHCGVKFLATAHAASFKDFRTRPVYRTLAESNVFDALVILHPDRSYHVERMTL